MKRLLFCLLAALLLCAAACAPNAPADPSAAEDGLPSIAPEAEKLVFSTVDLEGNTVDSAQFAEYDLIMMNFWAYWCGPCVAEMPDLEKLHREYENVLFLGVSVDNLVPEETQLAVEQTGVTYPILLPDEELGNLANSHPYIPFTYFYRPDGTQIGTAVIGAKSYDDWKRLIDLYL